MPPLARALPIAAVFSTLIALPACPQAIEDPGMVGEDPEEETEQPEESGDPAGVRIEGATFEVAVGASIEVQVWAVDGGGQRVQAMPAAQVRSTNDNIATATVASSEGGTTRVTVTGVAPGTVTLSATIASLPSATRQIVVTGAAEGPVDPDDWDPAVCCPGAVVSADDKNMCYLASNTPGCPMTYGDGYCDQDGDGMYSTPNDDGFTTGYYDAFDRCADYDGDEPTPPPGPCQEGYCSQDGGCHPLQEYPECCSTNNAHWVERIENADGSCGYEVGPCNLPQEAGVCP